MGQVAFIFAGQGAQAPGMGEALYQASPAAKAVFDAVEAQRPGTIEQCFRGDEATLRQTVNTQPCLFATDLACAMAAVEAGLNADCAAGFSLGELCAVAFADILPMADVARLVIKRAETMQACNEAHPGAMAAIVKLAAAQVEGICAEFDDAQPVNFNCPGQTVVACAAERLPDIAARAKAAGGRAMPLKVGGSFHTPVMHPATEALSQMLAEMRPKAPRIPVYANLTAGLYSQASARALIAEQASHPVRWQAILQAMAGRGVDTFVEVGPGTTLSGFVKRTLPDARAFSVSDPESLKACVAAINETEGRA